MSAIEVTSDFIIKHAELGAETWEWNSNEQADFLAGMAVAFKSNGGSAIFQISHFTESLRQNPEKLAAVRWLNDRLTEYLED